MSSFDGKRSGWSILPSKLKLVEWFRLCKERKGTWNSRWNYKDLTIEVSERELEHCPLSGDLREVEESERSGSCVELSQEGRMNMGRSGQIAGIGNFNSNDVAGGNTCGAPQPWEEKEREKWVIFLQV